MKTSRFCMQRYNGHYYIMLQNLLTTSGLSIILHGVISLPDATSCDKKNISRIRVNIRTNYRETEMQLNLEILNYELLK